MLVYKNGVFMQALEGEEMSVRWLSAKIAKDPRHKNIVSMADGPLARTRIPKFHGLANFREEFHQDPGVSPRFPAPVQIQAGTRLTSRRIPTKIRSAKKKGRAKHAAFTRRNLLQLAPAILCRKRKCWRLSFPRCRSC